MMECAICKGRSSPLGVCDVCRLQICANCAQSHNEQHDGTPLDVAASYLDRGAEIAQGISAGVRQVQTHLGQALGLLGIRIGKKPRRRRQPRVTK